MIRRSMAWPLPLLLASRYLKSSRRDAYVSFLSALAGGGIALGVAALILVLSGLSGLQHFLRKDVLERTPHLEVELPAASLEAGRELIAGVDGVRQVRVVIHGRGWLLVGGSAVDMRMVGFEGDLPPVFLRSQQTYSETVSEVDDDVGVWVSENFAARWALERGDRVELASARPTLTPFGQAPRLVTLRIAGTFEGGQIGPSQPRLALPLAAAKRLFGVGAARLDVRAEDAEAALDLAPAIRAALAENLVTEDGDEPSAAIADAAVVRTWRELNRGLFFALDLEKRLMFVSVFLIVPVASLALVTALALLISSKRAEVGMLGAMGATRGEISAAFLTLGTALSLGGLVLGGFLGISLALLFDHFGLIAPPGDVYYIDHVPFRLLARDLLAVIGATLLFTLVCTLYGARRAGALQPIEALRGP